MDVVVVGSLNMDYILQVPRIPRPGETVLSTGMSLSLGGKGLNQAVAAARSGARVDMIGAVGSDGDAGQMLELFQQEEMGQEGILRTEGSSGQAWITIDESGQNAIVVSPGANGRLTEDWISQQERLIRGRDWCILQLEIPLEAVYRTLETAGRLGVRTILNPAPVSSGFERRYLAAVDLLVVNETELELLSGGEKDPEKALEILLGYGAKAVLFTMGAAGSRFHDRDRDLFVPARKVTPVDTTGAGDTYIGAFASCFDGNNHRQAMEYATAAAALAVTRQGAIGSIPRKEEIE